MAKGSSNKDDDETTTRAKAPEVNFTSAAQTKVLRAFLRKPRPRTRMGFEMGGWSALSVFFRVWFFVPDSHQGNPACLGRLPPDMTSHPRMKCGASPGGLAKSGFKEGGK